MKAIINHLKHFKIKELTLLIATLFFFNLGYGQEIKLPAAKLKGDISLEEALNGRRSERNFIDKPISIDKLGQLLWSVYGVTKPMQQERFGGGFKTAPSAGATYPLEIYAAVKNVEGLESGLYRYIPSNHSILKVSEGVDPSKLREVSYNQKMVGEAPVVICFAAVFSRTTNKYGDRGRERYVCMDLGHAAQNLYLQSYTLGLGTCAVGAFNDKELHSLLKLSDQEEILYMMPVGYVKR